MLEEQLVHSAFHDSLTDAGQPGAVPRPASTRRSRALRARGAASPCSSSTSTASRRSTTASATRPATCCSCMVAERLRAGVRPGDTVARLGGDEFAVLLEDADDATAVDARRAHHGRRCGAVRRRRPARSSSAASIGIAIASTDARRRRPAAAQRRPRDVPGQGGRRGRRSSATTRRCTSSLVERLQLEADLRPRDRARRARPPLPADRRPRDRARSSGVEALVRWEHPDARPARADGVHPARRGHRADRRARQLGAARRPAAQASRLASRRRASRPTLTMSVNVSAGQLRRRLCRAGRRRCSRRRGLPGRAPGARDDRERAHGPHRGEPARTSRRCRTSACGSRSTTSAPATRRSATCTGSRSTCSRSTASFVERAQRHPGRAQRSSAPIVQLGQHAAPARPSPRASRRRRRRVPSTPWAATSARASTSPGPSRPASSSACSGRDRVPSPSRCVCALVELRGPAD